MEDKGKPDIPELIKRFELSNRAEGKSPRTVTWYSEMLQTFCRYLQSNHGFSALSLLDIHTVREYILYLRQKPRFLGHSYASKQQSYLSPKTIQCHVRALKAFASWLCGEDYTSENRLQNLKLPKAPVTIIEPLTPHEINKIIASIDKRSLVAQGDYDPGESSGEEEGNKGRRTDYLVSLT